MIKQEAQKPYKYEVASFEDYQQLQSSITTALDNILQKFNIPVMAQTSNNGLVYASTITDHSNLYITYTDINNNRFFRTSWPLSK